MNKLKRAVVKEELVALTGDFKKAVVLNQMIYWSERTRDFDKFILEEKKRIETYGQTETEMDQVEAMESQLTNGWIYKKADELSDEVMMNIHKSTMGKYLDELVKKGWLDRRRNPKIAMDKTYQYRVNLLNIQRDLFILGYFLEGYKTDLTELQIAITKLHETTTKEENATSSSETQLRVGLSNSELDNPTAIPEITSQITSETTDTDYHHKEIDEAQKQVSATKEIDPVVVVEYINLIKNEFGKELPISAVSDLIDTAASSNVDLAVAIKSTKTYYEKKKTPINDLIAVIKKGIEITGSKVSTNVTPSLPKTMTGNVEVEEESEEVTQARYADIQATMKFLRSTEKQVYKT